MWRQNIRQPEATWFTKEGPLKVRIGRVQSP